MEQFSPLNEEFHSVLYLLIVQFYTQSHPPLPMKLTFEGGDLVPQHCQGIMVKSIIQGVGHMLPRWGWVVVEVPVTESSSLNLLVSGIWVTDSPVHTVRNVQPMTKVIPVYTFQHLREGGDGWSGVWG